MSAMAAPLLQLTGIGLTFGGAPLLEGVDLMVGEGERLCLVGRNGSGKSTLLRITAGIVEADSGTRFVRPDATIRYLPQEPDLTGFATTEDYVTAGLGPNDDRHTARLLLEELGLHGDENPERLSGGEARRAAIARVLAPAPDILLLDEPTNHLDLPAIEWLEHELAARQSALIIVSHDRRFLTNLSRITVWLDRGRARRIERGFAEFEGWRDEVLTEEERERHKLDRKIVAEEHWLRYGVTARRKRNVRRLEALTNLRAGRRNARRASGTVALAAAEAERSGALVIEAKELSKSYGGVPVVKDLSLRIERGDRLGVIGPNGSGKTTLVDLLTRARAADGGTVRLGANLQMTTLDQSRESLNPDWTLAEALTGGRGDTVVVGGQAKHVIAYMRDFLFTPEQARTPLRVLSGGERGRLMLARALAKPSNVLVLDEPTNDLDLETLDVLEEMLSDYAGTVLLISHDRDFLDRVVDAVLVPEGNGKWTEYAGGYSDMLAQRGTDVVRKPADRSAAKRTEPRVAEQAKPERALTATPRRKLGFNDKHALETLPGRIAMLEAEIARLQGIMADPTLYARDRATFDRTSATLTMAQAELAAAEDRWLTLELLRGELESG
jgi:ABC transport system ATP-binding/permease protein